MSPARNSSIISAKEYARPWFFIAASVLRANEISPTAARVRPLIVFHPFNRNRGHYTTWRCIHKLTAAILTPRKANITDDTDQPGDGAQVPSIRWWRSYRVSS